VGVRPSTSSRTGSHPVTAAQPAAALLRSGVCVWCEQRPATGRSLLCDVCVAADPDGVLAVSERMTSPASSR